MSIRKASSQQNCKVNLILTWSANCIIMDSTDEGVFAVAGTKLYVQSQGNARLLKQL